ncbi:MAG: lectin-like protein [Chitinophagales bacterium]
MKNLLLLLSLLVFTGFIGVAQPVGCNIQAIRTAYTNAGYIELTGVQGQPCSMYFINPTSQDANVAEVAAQQLGGHLVVFNDAAENTAVVAALNAAGIISANQAVWIGYTDAASEGTWVTLDGTPMTYLNWSSGEPNNNGQGSSCCNFPDALGGCQSSQAWRCQYGEDCVQIYGGGNWNDLPCDRQSVSVIEVNLCPQITTTVPALPVCSGYHTQASATTILGSQPYSYTWSELPGGATVGNSSILDITPSATTSYQVQVTDRYSCQATATATVTTQVCTGPPGCDLFALRAAFAAAGYNELSGVQGQQCSLYFINPTSQDANAAETAARQLGAHLVVFNDAAENAAVVAALNAAGIISGNQAVWVGYTDQANEGTWVTLDGTPMTYLNWAPGEPNNNGQNSSCCSFPDWLGGCQSSEAYRCANGEDCPQIYSSGQWNDYPCNTQSVSVIEVNLCPQLTIPNDTAVCGGSTLSFSASTLLGSAPYVYTWNPGNSTANPYVVNPVVNTTYNVVVTDRWGCADVDNIDVTILGGGAQSFVILPDTVCENNPVTVNYTGTSPTSANYTWNFNGGTIQSGSGQGPYQVLWSGFGNKTITLDVTDGGCVSPQVSQTLTITAAPVSNAGPDVAVCSGGTVQIGSAPAAGFTYLWQPSLHLSDSTVSNPTYTNTNTTAAPVTTPYVLVGINGACFATDTVNVTVNPPAATTISAGGAIPVCAGGSVTLTSDSVYATYLWSDNSTANSVTVSQPGAWFMGAVDAAGCQYISNTINVTYNPPAPTTISAAGPLAFCQGGNVDLTSDSTYVSYLWSNNATGNNINVTQSGSFTLSGQDANGCQYTSNTLTVTVNPNPVLSLVNATDESCFAAADAAITVTANSGTPSYSYVWNTTPVQNTATASALSAGSYGVVVYDANQCLDSATYTVQSPAPLLLSVDNVTNATCFGYTDGGAQVSATGGVPPYNFNWSNGSAGAPLQNVGAATYNITVNDANNCQSSDSVVVTEPDQITLNSLSFDSIPFGTEIGLNVNITPANNSYTYSWSPAVYLSCTDCAMPAFSAIHSMEYQVVVTDPNGCSASGEIQVNVLADKQVFIPNVFTPDGNGQNDVFTVYALNTVYFKLTVFNRWGEKVFDSNNTTIGWDGTYQGKDAYPGVYSYVANITFLDGENRKYKGTVTLLK